MVIKPTIGRVIWYYVDDKQAEPFACFVTYVHAATLINVAGYNQPISGTSIYLVQQDIPAPKTGPYACWMPYQQTQAIKHADAEDQTRA